MSPDSAPTGASRSRERGQALVEFALIAPLFLLIVVGIIQFGIGLNYWLDLNRLANQGARWAVVDHGWDTCSSSDSPAGNASAIANRLQDYLKRSRASREASIRRSRSPSSGRRRSVSPCPCKMTSCYTFLPILDLGDIVLNATATMRIEQPPTRYSAAGNDLDADDPC